MNGKSNNNLIRFMRRLFTDFKLIKSAALMIVSFVMLIISSFAWYISTGASLYHDNNVIREIGSGYNIKFYIDGEEIEGKNEIPLVDAIPGTVYKISITVSKLGQTGEGEDIYDIFIGGAVGWLMVDYANGRPIHGDQPEDDVLKFFSISEAFLDDIDYEYASFRTIYEILNDGDNPKLIDTVAVPLQGESAIHFYVKVEENDPDTQRNDINIFQGCKLLVSNITLSLQSGV